MGELSYKGGKVKCLVSWSSRDFENNLTIIRNTYQEFLVRHLSDAGEGVGYNTLLLQSESPLAVCFLPASSPFSTTYGLSLGSSKDTWWMMIWAVIHCWPEPRTLSMYPLAILLWTADHLYRLGLRPLKAHFPSMTLHIGRVGVQYQVGFQRRQKNSYCCCV